MDQMPQTNRAPEPKPLTFPPPVTFSATRDGTSFALVPHTEAYHLGKPIFIMFWFRTTKAQVAYFRVGNGLKYAVSDAHGTAMKVSQPRYLTLPIRNANRGVAIMNGPQFEDDLAGLYKFTVAGTYTVTATIALADAQGVRLTSPPITIQIQNE
jgi:hypothetical protein